MIRSPSRVRSDAPALDGAGASSRSATLPAMADAEPLELVTAVYIGGDALLRAVDGATILPGDRMEVDATIVDVDGSPWASRIPRGQADRLELLAHNHRAAAGTGETLKADPLARHDDEPAAAVDAKE